jgi:trigger factor
LETNFLSLDGCNRELVVTLAAHELEPHYEKAYLAAQPEIQVQGFRKGKVPLSIIKKRFGKALQNDAVEDIATEVFRNIVEKEDIKPVGQPSLKDIQRETDGSLVLTIAYEVLPEFELAEYRNLEVEKLIYPVTEEDIDKEVERLTVERSALVDAEQIEDEMFFVRVRLNPIDAATGMPLIGGKGDEFNVFLKNEPPGSELKASLLNTKVGDSFRYTAPAAEGAPSQVAMASVQEIKHVVPAEFTNAFVEEVSQGRFGSTEEFRADIERQVAFVRKRSITESMQNQVVDKILSAHTFEPPRGLIQEVITNMLQQDVQRLPDKKLPKDFDMRRYVASATPVAANTAKWMIIRERIIEQENIAVNEDDITAHVDEMLHEMMGMDLPTENVEYFRSAFANDENVKSQILHTKLLNTILDYAVITEKDFKTILAEREAEEAAKTA